MAKKFEDKIWNRVCDDILLPVTLDHNMCYKGKCLKGDTNDGKPCSKSNRCGTMVDKPSDIPRKFRIRRDGNCFDIRSLLEFYENKLNSYNYITTPIFPEDPFTKKKIEVKELKEIRQFVNPTDHPILKILLDLPNKILEDFRTEDRKTLESKYGNPLFKNVFSNFLKASGYRYIGIFNNKFVDSTETPYGSQRTQYKWISIPEVLENK